jgi:hypothetical protein
MRRALVLLALVSMGCGVAKVPANSVCEPDGSAKPGVPLTLSVGFGFSGCASPDAVCTVSVDGGTITLVGSATVCSTGCNPGGSLPTAPCTIPPLEPGRYAIEPFSRVLIVDADGGGWTSCTTPAF